MHTYLHTHKASSLTPLFDTSKRLRLCDGALLEKTQQLHLYFKAEKLAKTGREPKPCFLGRPQVSYNFKSLV